MKKTLTCFLSALALLPTLNAQNPTRKPCATYEAMEEVFRHDPAARERYENEQAKLLQEEAADPQAKSSAFEYTVPVVFHVLHKGGPENHSDAYLKQALDWVNKDFDASHSDVGTIQQPFQSMFIPSDIKFVLAKKDPDGNCTNGIIHHYDSRTDWDRDGKLYYNSPLYAGITWNPTKYLNIIVVRDIVDNSGVIGYTFKPGTHGSGDTRDAVVIVGSFLNTFDNTRYLSHEIGHWLNLSHTFGDTNDPGIACGDDGVCDTPPTRGQLGGCPNSLSGNSCATTATCGYLAGMWNAENLMDYTDCGKQFTAGQTTRMRNALASSTSGRSNLWQPANLLATDVDGTGNCAPRADFSTSSESYTVCAGQTLSFKEYAFGGSIDNIQWSANNALVTSPMTPTTEVLFNAPGTATVTLTVSNSLGSNSKSKIIYVRDPTAQIIPPVMEGFEQGVLPADWSIYNPNATSGTWKHTWNAAYEGGGSFYLEGSTLLANQEDHLMTPIIDFTSSNLKEFSFAYAYARKASNTNDILKVQASTDCGGTWIDMYVRSANQLANGSGGTQATPFVPESSQWKVVSQNELAGWDNIKNSPHVIIKWLFIEGPTGNGNNFYLDAINIPNAVGVAELKRDIGLRVYPNPSSGNVNMSCTLSKESNITGTLTDLSGRVLETQSVENAAPGQHELTFNRNQNLAQGVYLLNVDVNGVKITEKVVIR